MDFGQSNCDVVHSTAVTLLTSIEEALNELTDIFQSMGYPADVVSEKRQNVTGLIIKTLKDMAAQERTLLQAATERAESDKKAIQKLQQELQLVLINDFDEDMPLITAVSHYDEVLKKLKTDKKNRLAKLVELSEELKSLHEQLDEHGAVPTFNGTPVIEELLALQKRVDLLQKLLANRKSCFQSCASEISHYATILNYYAESDFENMLIAGKLPHIYSTNAMEALNVFHEKIKEKYETYLETMELTYLETLQRLNVCWDNCEVAKEERESFLATVTDKYSSHTMHLLEAEIDHLNTYYNERKTVLEKVGEWKTLWARKVDLESSSDDPNRYVNRGCRLLMEEREKKQVDRDLIKIKQEICKLVAEWDAAHPNDPILLSGLLVISRLEDVETKYEEEKEQMKRERKVFKMAMLEKETIHGTSRSGSSSSKRKCPQLNVASAGKGRGKNGITPAKRFM